MCTAACASEAALEMLCAAIKAWRAAQAGRKTTKTLKRLRGYSRFGTILHCQDLRS